MNLRPLGMVAFAGLIGCQALAPALTSLAVAFGQDLIASASVNYAPRYAEQVETLLVAMAREGTGLPVEEQLAKAGYRPPPPDYGQGDPYEAGYGDEYGYDPYDPNEPYYPEDPYDPNGPYYPEDPYDPNGPYYPDDADYPDDPYYPDNPYGPNGGYGDPPIDPAYDGYPSTGGGYPNEPPYDTGYGDGYGNPLTMEVAVLVRRAGSATLEAIEDGAILFDGSGDPARGDLLRFHVRVDRPCYVYVIGVDATGYVAQIFPDPSVGLGNPVEPGYRYMLPTGDQWWGLDEQAGVENVYFIASIDPRPDIEAAVRQLGAQPRRLAVDNYLPVQRPAVVPTRGLVKVESSPVYVSTGADTVAILPESFVQAGEGRGVTVTRWFRHESR